MFGWAFIVEERAGANARLKRAGALDFCQRAGARVGDGVGGRRRLFTANALFW